MMVSTQKNNFSVSIGGSIRCASEVCFDVDSDGVIWI